MANQDRCPMLQAPLYLYSEKKDRKQRKNLSWKKMKLKILLS